MKWRVLFRLAGIVLLLAGLVSAYWWFYTMGPARRTSDGEWVANHSQQEYWREVQKGIHRGVWLHDDGFYVGRFGDKSWAEWIMSHVKPDTRMDCFGGHSGTAMQFITNQDVRRDAEAWLDWWKKNKSKSQEQWISDGFTTCGFAIDVPPKPGQITSLLVLLGRPDSNRTTPLLTPTKYNAFRCLRDSGFDPVKFALSNRAMSPDIERGLLEYAEWLRRWPAALGVGILPFGAKERGQTELPEMLTPAFQSKVYACIFVPTVLGIALVVWSFRRKNKLYVQL
jgi:hypothetical protein